MHLLGLMIYWGLFGGVLIGGIWPQIKKAKSEKKYGKMILLLVLFIVVLAIFVVAKEVIFGRK
jgi:hypothetical protein